MMVKAINIFMFPYIINILGGRMNNQDDIPMGIAHQEEVAKAEKEVGFPQNQEMVSVNRTNILDEIITKGPEQGVPRTDSNFRHRTTRQESRSNGKRKNKAVSEQFQIKHKIKESSIPSNVGSGQLKKPKETLHLPPASKKYIVNRKQEIKNDSKKIHHFDRKGYHNEQIIKDIEKNPIKYKIMCEVFGCKPNAAYEMPKEEASYLQEGYIRKKGMQYLREGNSRARYNYVRDKRVNTESSSKVNKYLSSSKGTVKISKSQKLLKLSVKQANEGKLVYDRVKRHITEGEKSANYFKHLSSEQSIDQALVSFLKTKIKRAQIVLK